MVSQVLQSEMAAQAHSDGAQYARLPGRKFVFFLEKEYGNENSFIFRTRLLIGPGTTECTTNIRKPTRTLTTPREDFSSPTLGGFCAESTKRSN